MTEHYIIIVIWFSLLSLYNQQNKQHKFFHITLSVGMLISLIVLLLSSKPMMINFIAISHFISVLLLSVVALYLLKIIHNNSTNNQC